MIPRGLVILGCGGHARSVADIALDLGIAELLFVDDNAADEEEIAGYRVVRRWPDDLPNGWQAMPATGTPEGRIESVRAARSRGLTLATIVSRRAYVAPTARIGAAALVAHGAHVGPFARVGEGAIVNTSAVVDHESIVGDYAHIAINASVAGRCSIGRRSLIGAGAVVIDGVSVGDDVSVGAGGVVVSDLSTAGVYVGVPVHQAGSR